MALQVSNPVVDENLKQPVVFVYDDETHKIRMVTYAGPDKTHSYWRIIMTDAADCLGPAKS